MKTLQIILSNAGEGRAVGNLGNAYTAIGEFGEAIQYHRRRLKIAQDANDLVNEARLSHANGSPAAPARAATWATHTRRSATLPRFANTR